MNSYQKRIDRNLVRKYKTFDNQTFVEFSREKEDLFTINYCIPKSVPFQLTSTENN